MQAGDFIVQWTISEFVSENSLERNGTRLYGHFDSYIEFWKFYQTLNSEEKIFQEVISLSPKILIDVDVNRTEKKWITDADTTLIKDYILDAVYMVLSSAGVAIEFERDLLLFESSDFSKFSLHIVIDNFYAVSISQVKSFYQAVVVALDKAGARIRDPEGKEHRVADFLDSGVYNGIQHFRMLGSSKLDGMGRAVRPKRFLEQFIYRGKTFVHRYREEPESEQHKQLLQFEQSLVGLVANCKIQLPEFKTNTDTTEISTSSDRKGVSRLHDSHGSGEGNGREEEKGNESGGYNYPRLVENLTDSIVSVIYNEIYKKAEIPIEINGVIKKEKLCESFTFGDVKDDCRIELKREAPGYCPLCQRVHDKIDAYLLVIYTQHSIQKIINEVEKENSMSFIQQELQKANINIENGKAEMRANVKYYCYRYYEESNASKGYYLGTIDINKDDSISVEYLKQDALDWSNKGKNPGNVADYFKQFEITEKEEEVKEEKEEEVKKEEEKKEEPKFKIGGKRKNNVSKKKELKTQEAKIEERWTSDIQMQLQNIQKTDFSAGFDRKIKVELKEINMESKIRHKQERLEIHELISSDEE